MEQIETVGETADPNDGGEACDSANKIVLFKADYDEKTATGDTDCQVLKVYVLQRWDAFRQNEYDESKQAGNFVTRAVEGGFEGVFLAVYANAREHAQRKNKDVVREEIPSPGPIDQQTEAGGENCGKCERCAKAKPMPDKYEEWKEEVDLTLHRNGPHGGIDLGSSGAEEIM